METKTCIDCKSDIPKDASVCRYCGNRIEGLKCPSCSSYCKSDATVCKWCGSRLQKKTGLALAKPVKIQSSFWGTLLSRFSILPQEAYFSSDKIIIATPGFFGLTQNNEEILWEKIAGFQHKDGIVWDTIWIETRGQSSASITALRKGDASKIKGILQKLEK